jgi:predicted phosphodiesterase
VKVALISDLHGNALALDAVLAAIASDGADEIVCLGDTATLGPRPNEVLARLRDSRCRCLMGNHDDFLLDARLIERYTEAQIVIDAVDWCRAQLSADELAWVGTFARGVVTIDLGAGTTLGLFHGTPRSHMEELLCTTPASDVDVMLAGTRAAVLAGGHTHLQMLRQHRGMWLVNPGSLGMPFREHAAGRAPVILAHAEYAVVEREVGGGVSVRLHRVPLSRAALRAEALAVAHPLAASLAEQYA